MRIHHLGDGQNSGRIFMKRLGKGFITVLLVMLMLVLGSSSAYAKESNEKGNSDNNGKGNDKKTIEVLINNVSKDTVLTVNETFKFEAKVKYSKNIKEKDKDGIVRWELSKDKAGVNTIGIDGSVSPTKEGSFKLRALYFESEKTYKNWLKKQNDNLIIAASDWEKINVQKEEVEYTSPTVTLIGNDVMFVQLGEHFIDPGATAYDTIDGDISEKITVNGGDIYSDVPSEHYVYYEVQNAAGYYQSAIRLVVVADLADSQSPAIKLNFISIEAVLGMISNLDYGTAWDYEDGNITNSIVIAGDEVDFNKAGRYDVILRATDSNGNTTEKSVIVVIQDPDNPKDYIAPELVIHGSITYYMSVGDTFVEEGYYCYDNFDTDIMDKVVINSNVDATKPGTYQITYDVTDAAGNVAEQAVRTVIVGDYKEPVITLNGDPIVFITEGEVYEELGATAIDNVDGDITDLISIIKDVEPIYPGRYAITYTVTDSAGNSSTLFRTLIVTEENSIPEPVINIDGYEWVFVNLGTSYQEIGAFAFDKFDGNISDKVIVGGDVINPNKEGIYYVTYDVVNSAGLSAEQITRKVIVIDWMNPIDYVEPDITLNGDRWMVLALGSDYIDPGFSAYDAVDGDLTGNVTIQGNVDTNKIGTYRIYYSVEDAAGNVAQVFRTVSVEDRSLPVITLNDDPIIFINQGDPYVELGATAVDELDGDLSDSIKITSDVDITSAGQYHVMYDVTDSYGNNSTIVRTVIVCDEYYPTAPILALNGYYYEFVNVGSEYFEKGIIAYDRKDGNISDRVIIGGDIVDSNKVGIYYVTYDVANSAGVSAVQFHRKVIVIDWSNPIDYDNPSISLNGDHGINIKLGEEFIDPGFTAFDEVDGDITSNVTVGGSVDTTVAGLYEITYSVQDAAGNRTKVTRNVYVEAEVPITNVSLNGSYVMYVNMNEGFVDPGVTLVVDGVDLTSQIIVNGSVDTTQPGQYQIVYENSHLFDGHFYDLQRIVVVIEPGAPLAPILTVENGWYGIIVEVGTEIWMPQVYAYDEVEGDISSRIVTSGDIVDFNTVGIYEIMYTVTDKDGLVSTITFTVKVVEDFE